MLGKYSCRYALGVVLALGIFSAVAALPPKTYYQLEVRSQEFTRALTEGNTWEIYQMFVPQLRREVSFQRFDSAFDVWYAGRRIVRAGSMVIDVKGLGGHVSTWPVFAGDPSYSYVYQSWFYDGQGWQLIWLSNILSQAFQYGLSDSAASEEIAAAALRYVATTAGLNAVRPGLALPDTVVVIWRSGVAPGRFSLPKQTVVTAGEYEAGATIPKVAFYFRFAAVRVLGNYATCAVDIVPTRYNRFGVLRRPRGALVYLELKDGSWRFNSLGKKW